MARRRLSKIARPYRRPMEWDVDKNLAQNIHAQFVLALSGVAVAPES
jgi:hypothetical protein